MDLRFAPLAAYREMGDNKILLRLFLFSLLLSYACLPGCIRNTFSISWAVMCNAYKLWPLGAQAVSICGIPVTPKMLGVVRTALIQCLQKGYCSVKETMTAFFQFPMSTVELAPWLSSLRRLWLALLRIVCDCSSLLSSCLSFLFFSLSFMANYFCSHIYSL